MQTIGYICIEVSKIIVYDVLWSHFSSKRSIYQKCRCCEKSWCDPSRKDLWPGWWPVARPGGRRSPGHAVSTMENRHLSMVIQTESNFLCQIALRWLCNWSKIIWYGFLISDGCPSSPPRSDRYHPRKVPLFIVSDSDTMSYHTNSDLRLFLKKRHVHGWKHSRPLIKTLTWKKGLTLDDFLKSRQSWLWRVNL